MQMVERGNTAGAFRMDDRSQRLVVDRSLADGERYFGFEVADAAALQALAARLDAARVAVTREPKATADQRFVEELISFHDPAGNRLEAFHGAAIASAYSVLAEQFPGSGPAPWGWGMWCSMCVTWMICWDSIAMFWDRHQRLHPDAIPRGTSCMSTDATIPWP